MKHLFYVNEKPFFSIGGQVHNSTSYSKEKVEHGFKTAVAIGLNTLALPIYWESLESIEGDYDYGQVEMILDMAVLYDMHVILLWFGSWKNGVSTFIPKWMKKDRQRFTWVRSVDGNDTACISAHCQESKEADKKAFARLCNHIKEYDVSKKVIAIQVQNEAGIMGTPRDYGEKSNYLYGQQVPQEVAEYYAKEGTWETVFGCEAAEFFTTYYIAKYVDEVAEEGKKVYDIPMYVNVWLGESNSRIPGINYPSGGPVSKTISIYRLAMKNTDAICPDIYLQDRDSWNEIHNTYGNGEQPYYIPELMAVPMSITNAFRAIGDQGLCGVHYFAVDEFMDKKGNIEPEFCEMVEATRILKDSIHLIQKYQGSKNFYVVAQYEGMYDQYVEFGNYIGSIRFHGDFFEKLKENKEGKTLRAKGFIAYDGEHTFYLTGTDYHLMLYKKECIEQATNVIYSGDFLNVRNQRFVEVAEGFFDDRGEYIPCNYRNGDEVDRGYWVSEDSRVVRVVMM